MHRRAATGPANQWRARRRLTQACGLSAPKLQRPEIDWGKLPPRRDSRVTFNPVEQPLKMNESRQGRQEQIMGVSCVLAPESSDDLVSCEEPCINDPALG